MATGQEATAQMTVGELADLLESTRNTSADVGIDVDTLQNKYPEPPVLWDKKHPNLPYARYVRYNELRASQIVAAAVGQERNKLLARVAELEAYLEGYRKFVRTKKTSDLPTGG